MKLRILSIVFLVLVLAMSGCGSNATPSPSSESPAVQDKASLISALQSAGATAELGDSISQDFFSVEGQFITINGTEGIQVFEYENAEAMESEASEVAPDGGSIGTSMVNWVDAPHFYKSGRIIVLYIGNNETVLALLEKIMGKQIAGR
jgi:hypothetical protein